MCFKAIPVLCSLILLKYFDLKLFFVLRSCCFIFLLRVVNVFTKISVTLFFDHLILALEWRSDLRCFFVWQFLGVYLVLFDIRQADQNLSFDQLTLFRQNCLRLVRQSSTYRMQTFFQTTYLFTVDENLELIRGKIVFSCTLVMILN